MGYQISYVCINHTGLCRRENQDNFLCEGIFLPQEHTGTPQPLRGSVRAGKNALFGVFDGIGGGERGEAAAYLAAGAAAGIRQRRDPEGEFLAFCGRASDRIQAFREEHNIGGMGTTATVLSFSGKQLNLCHLGDSRAYRFRAGELTRLTRDHAVRDTCFTKPLLTQYLGMPREEVQPFLATAPLQDGDTYLICSDGLTDMLTEQELRSILQSVPFDSAAEHLLKTALCRGGRDNITLILCKTQESARIPMRIKRLLSKGNV